MEFVAFVRRHARPLAFGALHAFFSAPGQTFVIGLFVASFSQTLGISPAGVGALYLTGTVASAATLVFVGHLIDRVRLVYFSAAVFVGLAVACFVAASASGPFGLFATFFLLRLTGQGLMIHVEATATARMFDAERGRALGITALGLPLGQFVFPLSVAAGIAAIGWRSTYAFIGVLALAVALPLTQWLLSGITRLPRIEKSGVSAFAQLRDGLKALLRSRYVWAILPGAALMPFCGTAIQFHLTTIGAIRGWPLGLVAASLPVGAVTNVIGLFVSGHFIDRFSARRMIVLLTVPFMIGATILAIFSGPWALPLAFVFTGLSGGMMKTTMTAIWAEMFGTKTLGTIRSAVTMYMVFASALGPFAFGLALDGGWSVSQILAAFVAYGLLAMLLVIFAERRGLA